MVELTGIGGDAVAWGCVLAALAFSAAAFGLGRRGRFVLAALLLVTAGVLLRTNLSYRYWLSDWDERFHAVVGRNALDDPLTPSVIPREFDAYEPPDWGVASVWLHKPPLATWMIAGSLRVFGESEPAVRIPSVAFAGLGIFLTFLIGRRLIGAPGGLVAAAFHAWHGRLAQLAAGLRATDHVDHQFIVWVALGVYLALRSADALERRPGGAGGWLVAGLCGVAVGLALLTKSSPAWVVVGVFGLALLVRPLPWTLRLAAPALAVALAFAVELPWQLYTERAFPEYAAWAARRNELYFTHVIAGQAGPPWFYLSDMADVFGALAPVAVALFLAHGLRRRALWPALAWLGVPYLVFSLSQTKMTGYVLIAAPMVMVAMAWAVTEAFSEGHAGGRRLGLRVLAVGLVVGFVLASAGRVHRPWRAPERRTAWAEELRFLGERVAELGPGPWLVFGTPSPMEARFYTRQNVVARRPEEADLEKAARLGFRTALYAEPGDPLAARARPGLALVPLDPRTAPQREILSQLPRVPEGSEVWMWNARDSGPLEEYLERFVPTDVRARIPDAADLARVERSRGITAILVPPGAPDPELPPGASWVRIESARFANPVP